MNLKLSEGFEYDLETIIWFTCLKACYVCEMELMDKGVLREFMILKHTLRTAMNHDSSFYHSQCQQAGYLMPVMSLKRFFKPHRVHSFLYRSHSQGIKQGNCTRTLMKGIPFYIEIFIPYFLY